MNQWAASGQNQDEEGYLVSLGNTQDKASSVVLHFLRVCVCGRACVRACVCAFVRACVRAYVRACVINRYQITGVIYIDNIGMNE